MKKAIVSALLAAPTLMAGTAYLTPTHNVQHLDYKLVDEALVIIPVDNPAFADAAANLYLQAAGFDIGPAFPADLDACSSDGRRRLPVPRVTLPARDTASRDCTHTGADLADMRCLATLTPADIRPIRLGGSVRGAEIAYRSH